VIQCPQKLHSTHTHTHTQSLREKGERRTQILTLTSYSTPKCCSVISLLALLNRNFCSMTPCVSKCLCQSFLSFFLYYSSVFSFIIFWLFFWQMYALQIFGLSCGTFVCLKVDGQHLPKLMQTKCWVVKLANDYCLFAQIMAECFGFTIETLYNCNSDRDNCEF